jgi:hypothetical protein
MMYNPMSLHEKLQIGMKSIALKKEGKLAEAEQLHKQIPLPPYLARFYKKHLGLDALLDRGWNLSEALEEYGPEFLSR